MDVEGGLISAILTGGSMNEAMERRVGLDWFSDPTYKAVWRHMMTHWSRYSTQPTVETVKAAYPSLDIFNPGQPAAYFIQELANRRRTSIIADGLETAADLVNAEDPDKAMKLTEHLEAVLQQAHIETAPVQLVSNVQGIRRVMERWKAGESPEGISFGFDSLDRWLRGIRPGQLIVFTGHPKSRKSWVLLWVAQAVQASGHPAMFVTFEMSNDEQFERHISLMAAVPYPDVLAGTLSPLHLQKVGRFLHVKELLPALLFVEDPYGFSTVASLQALVKEHSPSVLFIDGVYFMTDETGISALGGDSKALTNISRSLKRLAKSEQIGVVVTTQQLASKTKGGQTSLYGIGYSSAFAQDADAVVGVEKVGDNSDIEGLLRVLASRASAATGNYVQVHWDMSNGAPFEMYTADPSGVVSGDDDDGDGGTLMYPGSDDDGD